MLTNFRLVLVQIHESVPNGVKWLEEFLPPDDYEGYAEVKRKVTTTLLTTGEHEYTRYGFKCVLLNAVGVLFVISLCPLCWSRQYSLALNTHQGTAYTQMRRHSAARRDMGGRPHRVSANCSLVCGLRHPCTFGCVASTPRAVTRECPWFTGHSAWQQRILVSHAVRVFQLPNGRGSCAACASVVQ